MEEFLAGMFGTSVSAERRLALFTVPERRARFFADLDSASKVASKLAESQNVYFGMGLIQGTPSGRGKQEDIAGIVALWADVDFAGDAHSGKALPSNDDRFSATAGRASFAAVADCRQRSWPAFVLASARTLAVCQ
jgi:hypothetical protein